MISYSASLVDRGTGKSVVVRAVIDLLPETMGALVKWGARIGDGVRAAQSALQQRVDEAVEEAAAHKGRVATGG